MTFKFVLAGLALAFCALNATADDEQIFSISSDDAARVLTEKALQSAEFRQKLADQVEDTATASDVPVRVKRNKSLDFRITAPQGLSAVLTYTPVAPITVGVSLDSLLGATVGASAEATFNVVWPKNWTKNCSLVITARLSHVRFNGLTDDIANEVVQQMYGKDVTVKMAGRHVDAGSALGGIDCVFDRGVHLMAKGGYIMQLGDSYGGDNSTGELIMRGWKGPTADLGIGWSF